MELIGPDGESDEAMAQRKAANEMKIAEAKQGQKLQHIIQEGVLKMQLNKAAGEQKQVLAAQAAMGKIAAKDADLQTMQQRKKAASA